jgi:limonene 1,2-monooxygenase
MAHNWADFPQTQRSYELIARYVMPRFNGDNAGRLSSMQWTSAHRAELMDAGRQAKVVAAQKYAAEREQKGGS